MTKANALVVVAHPAPGSLNSALAGAAQASAERAGARTVLHDLYADGFDPRLRAEEIGTAHFTDPLAAAYARDLRATDLLVIVHPVWFFQVPAILKGWVDRVVREDVAFVVDGAGGVTGLLAARSALVVTTGNSSVAVEREVFGDPVTRFWRDAVLRPTGVAQVERLAFTPVRDSSTRQREEWLAAVGEAVSQRVGAL